MAFVALQIQFDDKALRERLDRIAKDGQQAIANAVTTTARAAKRDFTTQATQDIGILGEGRSGAIGRFRKHLKRITPAAPGHLTASFTVLPPGGSYGLAPQIKSMLRGNQHKAGGGTVSTHILTGGGSANLTNSGFFVIEANGGKVVLVRKSHGAGSGRRLDRRLVKKIYAETPSAAMKQEDAAPRLAWELTASTMLSATIGAALQTVFNGGAAPAARGND
jgi:hypothetical protein